MTETSSIQRLLGNSTWNATAFSFGVALNVLIIPFVISRLGIAAFGVAGLVMACIAPAQAFSSSLAMSTTRELTQRLSPDERKEARRFFAASLLLAILVGGSIVAFLCAGGPPVAQLVFQFGDESADDLKLAFALGACGWLCQCVSAVFLAPFTARQDFYRVASVNMLGTIVMTISIVALVPLWPRASTYVGCQALGFAASVIAAVVLACYRLGKWLAFPAYHHTPLSDLVNVGAWQMTAQASGLIAARADRYLLGVLLAPQFVGFYTVAQRLEEAVYVGVLKIGESLFPFFSTLQKESSERKADLLLRSSWILNVLAASTLGGLIPVAGPLLYLWTGAEVANGAREVLVMLSIAGMLGCTTNAFAFYLLAVGRTQSTALISFVTAFVTLATSAVALPAFGWQAAGWSACIGMVAQSVTTTLLLRRSFDHRGTWLQVVHFVWMPLATGIATALLLDYYIGAGLFERHPHWWYVLSLYGLAAAIIFTVVVAISGLGPYGAVCWRDLRAIATRLLASTRLLS
jgi:O-antigen/teichoic acid export membrane protein